MNGTENETVTVQSVLQETPITNENWQLFVLLISLSTIFLLSAVVIYLLLWNKQNLHGWTQFSYLVSFSLFNLVFIPALCPGLVQGSEINPGCFILAVANQYFFVSSKTWLLIIAFDILWNLWKFELIIDRRKNGKALVLYSIIGWIFPLGFVSCGVTINLVFYDTLRKKLYDPGLWAHIPDYGHLHCRIPNWSVWEVFVFSNCILHFVMFSLIIFIILKHRFKIREAIDASSTSRDNSSRSIVIFLKLFIVVGLSWSYIALQDLLKAGNINTNQGWGWHIFRIVFFLQGVFISVVYVGNLKTLRSLEDKFPTFKRLINKVKLDWMTCPKLLKHETFSNSTNTSCNSSGNNGKSKLSMISRYSINSDKGQHK